MRRIVKSSESIAIKRTEDSLDTANTDGLKKLYPDYKVEDTFVVTRTIETEEDFYKMREEVERDFGKILEEIVPATKAVLFGKAYFRVNRPKWTK